MDIKSKPKKQPFEGVWGLVGSDGVLWEPDTKNEDFRINQSPIQPDRTLGNNKCTELFQGSTLGLCGCGQIDFSFDVLLKSICIRRTRSCKQNIEHLLDISGQTLQCLRCIYSLVFC